MAIEAGATLVLLAHHRRDQAETLLLQALRGAGVEGLSAMPSRVVRDGVTWARPWLERTPEEIAAYAQEHALQWVEDDSNRDPRFARNRLRLQVWPQLSRAFPEAEKSLAASAARLAEVGQAAAERTAHQLAVLETGTGALDLNGWCELSVSSRSGVLRAWLARRTGRPASATLIRRLMSELCAAGSARWTCQSGELFRYRGVLAYRPSAASGAHSRMNREALVTVAGPGLYHLPGWGGDLEVTAGTTGGVAPDLLGVWTLKARVAGESFQAGRGRPARMLKKQYQSAGISAWDRAGPLIYCGERLMYVPGLGVDARLMASSGVPQMCPRWLPGS